MRAASLGWVLAIVTAGTALASAVAYLTTGVFTTAWLVGVVVVYALVLVAAVVLLAFDRRGVVAASAGAPPMPEGALLEARETIYETCEGRALRLTYRWRDGRRETRLLAVAGEELLHQSEIETYADALPDAAYPTGLDESIDQILARQAARPTPETA